VVDYLTFYELHLKYPKLKSQFFSRVSIIGDYENQGHAVQSSHRRNSAQAMSEYAEG
jgi:hypothetical protein